MPSVSQVIVTSTSKLFDTSPGVSLDALLSDSSPAELVRRYS